MEVGDRLRTTIFELMAPSFNRLLAAYAPAKTIIDLNERKTTGGLDLYALVEVMRQAEYADCTQQAFEEMLKGAEASMGAFVTENVGQLEEEMNIRLKSLGTKPIEVGRPEMLGGVFRKTDAAGFAMLVAIKQNDRSVTMAGAFAMVRVKQRLIYAYLFRRYESPDTVRWLRKNLDVWADAIVARNE